MALFFTLFLTLLGGPPPVDTPGGPIVQSAPIVQTAAAARRDASQA